MKKLALVTIIGLILSGCGGGGSSDSGSTPKPDIKPETKPALVEGTIDNYNSKTNVLTVNNALYDISTLKYADKTIDKALYNSLLQKSMMVNISKSGVVNLEPTMVGPISIPNENDRSKFSINGVQLQFTELSSNIDNGDWVMVSTLPMATNAGVGYKVLSVIEVEQGDIFSSYELEGRVHSLNENHHTFKLGQVTIEYVDQDLEPGFSVANGQWVEVQGDFDSTRKVFMATKIDLEDYDIEDNEQEIEGIITWVSSKPNSNGEIFFELNMRGRFVATSTTSYDDHTNASMLTEGALIEVTANNINGRLVASEIEFEDSKFGDDLHDKEVSGFATNLDINNKTFTVSNIEILTDSRTYFDGFSSLEQIANEYVDVDYIVINGQKIAREIELEELDD